MFDFFANMFGYILNWIYLILKNYGLAIILFSILMKIILLPMSVKQQKTLKKTEKLQKEVRKIQDKYKSNPEKMNQEMMDLYKRENMSPFSGCLGTIVQFILLISMFILVRKPLTHMKKVDPTVIDNYLTQIKQEQGENSISKSYPEIGLIKYANGEAVKKDNEAEESQSLTSEDTMVNEIIENTTTVEVVEEKKEEKLNNWEELYINMNFLGLDLSNIPQENYDDLTVFIIPVLYVLSSILSIKITTNMTKKKKEEDSNKEIVLDKDGSPTPEEPDMSTQMNKSMMLMMPILSVTISLVAPLGLALYWLVNNILMIMERLILNKVLIEKREEKEDA